MAEKAYEENISKDAHQMVPLLPPTYNYTVGLECLRMVDTISVKQIPSLSEVICGIPSQAKFDVFNERKERIFQALETSTFCQRLWCPTRRRFTLSIVNNINQEIILIKRPLKCCSGCCWCADNNCCSQEITVESPPGTFIGTVSQIGSCCRYTYEIKDENETPIFTLMGPVLICDGPSTCCCENKFQLIGTDGVTEVGAIYKRYRGFLSEAFSSADAFLLKMPMDLDLKAKALALSALFLIDFMIFSAVPGNN